MLMTIVKEEVRYTNKYLFYYLFLIFVLLFVRSFKIHVYQNHTVLILNVGCKYMFNGHRQSHSCSKSSSRSPGPSNSSYSPWPNPSKTYHRHQPSRSPTSIHPTLPVCIPQQQQHLALPEVNLRRSRRYRSFRMSPSCNRGV